MSMARSPRDRAWPGLVVVFLLLIGIGACDAAEMLDQPKGDGPTVSAEIAAALPEGYVYDGRSRALRVPSGPNALAAPAYVTEVALTITGADIEPRVILVPLDTLRVSVTLTFGERTFAIGVKTKNGDTFTGSRTVVVGPGMAGEILIPLEVNAPPVIDRIDLSDPNPKPGDTLVLTGFAHDPDADDTLTYSWRGTAPDGSVKNLSGQSVSVVMPPIAGTYTATLTAADDKGGSDSKSGTVTIDYAKPVIRGVNFSGTLFEGNTVTAAVDLFQTSSDYVYRWEITLPNGSKLTGNQPSLTVTNIGGGSYSYWVNVTDAYGMSATYSGSFTVDCAQVTATPGTPSATAHASINGGVVLTWTAVANAKSYFVKVYNGSMVLQSTKTGVTTTSTVLVGPVSQNGYFAVGGADCLDRQGPLSGTAGPTTYPGIMQPVNLAQTGSATNSTSLHWQTDSNATGFTMSWTFSGGGSGSATGSTGGAATCPGGAPWSGAGNCVNYLHTCTTGTAYTYTVTESNANYTSEKSASYTYTCQ
jgi:hypothetical protein